MLRVSGISDRDNLELIATLRVAERPAWQCDKCLKTHEKYPERRNALGCHGGTSPVAQLKEYRLYRCPGNFTHPTAAWVWELYNHFEKGILPFPGSLMEQPAQLIEAFGVIENLKIERQKQEAKNVKRNPGKR